MNIVIICRVQEGRISILGKIEFFVDMQNKIKNTQFKTYFKSEVKVVLLLWQNEMPKNNFNNKRN